MFGSFRLATSQIVTIHIETALSTSLETVQDGSAATFKIRSTSTTILATINGADTPLNLLHTQLLYSHEL